MRTRFRMGPSKTSGLGPALAALAVVVILFMCNQNVGPKQLAEARYLPTRSDQTEIETLKSIIRSLLIEAASTPVPRSHSHQRFQQQEPIGGPNYLQRRAAEMSVSSSNGDDSEGYLMGQLAPETSGNTVRLFKEASSKPDRR